MSDQLLNNINLLEICLYLHLSPRAPVGPNCAQNLVLGIANCCYYFFYTTIAIGE